MAGGACGQLKTGRWLNNPAPLPQSNLNLSLINLFGLKLKKYSQSTKGLPGLNELANFKVKKYDESKWKINSKSDSKLKARGFLILNPEDGGRSHLLKLANGKSIQLKLEFEHASKLNVDDFTRKEIVIEGIFSVNQNNKIIVNKLVKIASPQ